MDRHQPTPRTLPESKAGQPRSQGGGIWAAPSCDQNKFNKLILTDELIVEVVWLSMGDLCVLGRAVMIMPCFPWIAGPW